MREACRISALALQAAGKAVEPGVTTGEIDRVVEKCIRSHGAVPSFLGYGGFPKSACISVNNEVIHGIPGGRVIQAGDIVSVDVGACFEGYHGDNANTYPAGEIAPEAQRLIDVTRESFYQGYAQARLGNRLGDICSAIGRYIEQNGYAIVKKYVGHGVGHDLHESPEVPNYGRPGHGVRLAAGMTLAIEPMVNAKGEDVRVLSNEWTVVTASGSLSAHYENTIAITPEGPVILTTVD